MPRPGAGLRAEARAPGLRVLADGVALPGVMAADVWANSYLAANRFRVQLAAGAGGLAAVDAPGVRLDVQVGLGGAWSSLVTGEADCVRLDPSAGVIEVDGRDLAALMVDSRVDEVFANRTSSEIAELLAARHGLGSSVQATGTAVGRYYQSDHQGLTMGQFARVMSEWDLVTALAAREGFEVFVAGNVLRFGPADVGAAVVLAPGDCEHIALEHQLAVARQIEVTARSWDQQGAAAVAATATGKGTGRVWKHTVTRPNMTADEAQLVAERVLADLVRHERRVTATMPGELAISVRGTVTVTGTGTDWDRRYAVAAVDRQVSVRRGFTQRVTLLEAA